MYLLTKTMIIKKFNSWIIKRKFDKHNIVFND